jgi:hypothetical protein
MVLGHYAEIVVQANKHVIKIFQPRHISDTFRQNDRVSLTFEKYHVY